MSVEKGISHEQLGVRPRIAIIGASGRVAGELLAMPNTEITAITRSRMVEGPNVRNAVTGFDITDRSSVERTFNGLVKDGVRTVVLSAGIPQGQERKPAYDMSEAQRDDRTGSAYRTYTEGTRHAAEAGRETGLKVIFISTEGVFTGKPPGEKYTESEDPFDFDHQSTWYGRTHAWGEQHLKELHPDGSVSVRLPQIQSPKGSLFAATIKNLREGHEFTRASDHLVAPLTGIRVASAVANIEQSLHDPEKYPALHPVINLASSDSDTSYEISMRLTEAVGMGQLAERLIEPVSIGELVQRGEFQTQRPVNSILDVSKYESLMQESLPTVDGTIAEYISFYNPLQNQ